MRTYFHIMSWIVLILSTLVFGYGILMIAEAFNQPESELQGLASFMSFAVGISTLAVSALVGTIVSWLRISLPARI